jgi:hypothetical protein
MYLGVTEGVSADSPIMHGEVYDNVRRGIARANGGFDEIYLFDGRHLAFPVRESPTDSAYITHHAEWLADDATGRVAREYIRRISDDSFALNVFAPLALDDDQEAVLVAIAGMGPTIRARTGRLARALSDIRFMDLALPRQPWEIPVGVSDV